MHKDVVAVLDEDHAVLRRLVVRLRSAVGTPACRQVFNEFARTLGGHHTVIDQTVIPALKACKWHGLSSDVLAGHLALKRTLAELLTLPHVGPDFEWALARLLRQLERQGDLEDRKLLPLLARELGDTQRALLAIEAETHLARILGETPREGELGLPADELLQEAQLVLGSLPRRSFSP